MIDRKKPPKITTDFDLSIKGLVVSELSNGIKLYEFKAGSQPILKLDVVLGSGRVEETKIGTAKAAISLLREGSVTHDAVSLSKAFDFYGAVIKNQGVLDHSNLNLVVLEKYFDEVWPVWFNMINYPMYPADEIAKYKQLTIERMQVQLAQNDVLAYRKITEHLFGAEHPYGYNTEIENVQALNRDHILEYYNRNFAADNINLILSGNYSDSVRNKIIQGFENMTRKRLSHKINFQSDEALAERIQINTANELQTSIKMGCPLFNYYHEDYSKFKMLSMVFGGYFGSRLMKNIREEKGYTYGIYSASHCLKEGGYFYISADVGQQYLDATIEEIMKEMDLLKNETISEKELQMVKNYVSGQFLTSLDGPFAKAQLVKNLVAKGLSVSTHNEHVSKMANTTALEIQELANKYFNIEAFSIVCAGGSTG